MALGCEYYQVSSNPHYLTTLDHRVSEVIFDYENWRILFYAQSIRLSDAGRSVKFSGTKSGVSGVWGSRSSNSHFARDEDTPVFALGYSQDLGDRFPLFPPQIESNASSFASDANDFIKYVIKFINQMAIR